MTVIFYEMTGCGFCVKSKEALANEINSGLVQVKPASEAGGKFNGFPAFENTLNGKVHLGAVNSYAELAEKLDISLEHFQMMLTTHQNMDVHSGEWGIGVL